VAWWRDGLGIPRWARGDDDAICGFRRCSLWCCHGDCVWVRGIARDLDSIANRKESVEALDKVWISVEQFRNAVNDAWSVNAGQGKKLGDS
jgi:hypothetical protein